jgi:hypothetical protein
MILGVVLYVCSMLGEPFSASILVAASILGLKGVSPWREVGGRANALDPRPRPPAPMGRPVRRGLQHEALRSSSSHLRKRSGRSAGPAPAGRRPSCPGSGRFWPSCLLLCHCCSTWSSGLTGTKSGCNAEIVSVLCPSESRDPLVGVPRTRVE